MFSTQRKCPLASGDLLSFIAQAGVDFFPVLWGDLVIATGVELYAATSAAFVAVVSALHRVKDADELPLKLSNAA